MSEGFLIGGLAKRTGHSVHTIRWYENQGLIPGVERDAGGRRVYAAYHVEHLAFLERLRHSGMTIAEMRTYCDLSLRGWRTLPECRALLDTHRAQVEERIEALYAALDLIDQKVAWYTAWVAAKKRPPLLPPVEQSRRRTPARVKRAGA